jgi:hypothetical protein
MCAMDFQKPFPICKSPSRQHLEEKRYQPSQNGNTLDTIRFQWSEFMEDCKEPEFGRWGYQLVHNQVKRITLCSDKELNGKYLYIQYEVLNLEVHGNGGQPPEVCTRWFETGIR